MKEHGVARSEGIAMNMEQPHGSSGGRHRKTRTYGKTPDLSRPPIDELEADIADVHQIYQSEGLLTSKIQASLRRVKSLNLDRFKKVFTKGR